ncbi:MAG: hypothetical protein K6T81_06840 [Alicyclobacillus macrosporangiidus]|uniref:hypothetical protein n=1 Tax=Alicyclobacillus macrosporangiidus TaxID=392015 RepID=UPI0026EA0774|nr:hypothetical protein [Alicyclobacillus macrosporangiidus]MCL6598443.1 hypothetical protein [Alicyclobacillus macrosporangiidus]
MDLKPLHQNKWLIFLGLIGIACLLLGTFAGRGGGRGAAAVTGQAPAQSAAAAGTPAASDDSQLGSVHDLEQRYAQQLAGMLKQMQGIEDVSVMVTVDSTESLQLAQNTQQTTQTQTSGQQTTSQSTTTRSDVFTERTGDGDSVPFVTQRVTPKVRGVLVLVKADDFYVAKAQIIDAIRHVLDVPAYKISVEPER